VTASGIAVASRLPAGTRASGTGMAQLLAPSVSDVTRSETVRLMLDCGRDATLYRVAAPPGPVGECWANARAYCRANPGCQYVEGVVRRGPGADWELHGYCLTPAGVIETTEGYAGSVAYRGLPLDLAVAEAWLADRGEGEDLLNPAIWLAIWDAIEAAGEPYRLPRRFRLPHGLLSTGVAQ
jgi:hypothetical protein